MSNAVSALFAAARQVSDALIRYQDVLIGIGPKALF